jgi:DNA helicase-2/ATP-dependent DNA helicase PcrA
MRLTHPLAGFPPPLPDASGLLEGLTPEQALAVQHGRGPLLVLAGPGAGKTRALTHRAAYLITTGGARASEILAVTFSVRAAGELRLRLADLLGHERVRGVTAATFHAVCARLLREHAHLFGRSEQYTIYDQGDVRRVIEQLIADPGRRVLRQALKATASLRRQSFRRCFRWPRATSAIVSTAGSTISADAWSRRSGASARPN